MKERTLSPDSTEAGIDEKQNEGPIEKQFPGKMQHLLFAATISEFRSGQSSGEETVKKR